jgi:hypothetical protein
LTASQAPLTIGPGAKSPPIASKATRIVSLHFARKVLIPMAGPAWRVGSHDKEQAPGRRKSRWEASFPPHRSVRGIMIQSG